jgi:adenylosuccinate lyase
MQSETDNVGYAILPLVQQLVEMCDEAGRCVHWGAMTEHIMDTANIVQVRDAFALAEELGPESPQQHGMSLATDLQKRLMRLR